MASIRGKCLSAWAAALTLTFAVSQVAVATEAEPPPHQPTLVPGTPVTTVTPPAEINVALREPSSLLTTSNLLDETAQANKARQNALQGQLEFGLRQSRAKDYPGAEKTFVSLLEADVPAELQRTAMLELALIAQANGQPARAQQIYSQYLAKFSDDPSVAEVMLRQGLLFRQMGAPALAILKFHAVMTAALRVKSDRLEYYQRLVLQAQTEIADTHYLQGKFTEAVVFFNRLLKLESSQLNTGQVRYKLVRSLSALGRYAETVAQAGTFVTRHADSAELPEVRFLMADALKKLGRTREAMQQVLALLEAQQTNAIGDPENWIYWQQRAGNEIANQLYKEGDYLNALEIYTNLAKLNRSAPWQLPVWYQMGLVFERLQQPQKAAEIYNRMLDRAPELEAEKSNPNLTTVMDMARWRKDHLQWQLKAEQATAHLRTTELPPKAVLSSK